MLRRWFRKRIRRMFRKRQGHISCEKLNGILSGINDIGERCNREEYLCKVNEYLKSKRLDNCICFSENSNGRYICEVSNIVIETGNDGKNEISWGWLEKEEGVYSALSDYSLHFKNCDFMQDNDGSFTVNFICNSYYMNNHKLIFEKCESNKGLWFYFSMGCNVEFVQSYFKGLTCSLSDSEIDGNNGIIIKFNGSDFEALHFNFQLNEISDVSFYGGNEIDSLELNGVTKETRVFVDDREGIRLKDKGRNKGRRDLVELKRQANEKADYKQERVLSNLITRVDYEITREGKGNWQIKFQKWVQKKLSDFHVSWVRPLFLLIVGYFGLNAVPMIFVDGFSWGEWWEFSVMSLVKFSDDYVDVLSEVVFDGKDVELEGELCLHIVGLCRILWVFFCGVALAKVLKTPKD